MLALREILVPKETQVPQARKVIRALRAILGKWAELEIEVLAERQVFR